MSESSKKIDRIELQPGYSISRIIKGGWHLAGGHGAVDESMAIADMKAYVQSGITTFDCADIYTGVEELIGKFLSKYRQDFKNGDLPAVQIHTKYVPDYNSLSSLKKKDTTRVIDRSLLRLGVERLDLVQFAWWDYAIPGYVETALHLSDLQKQGKIRYLGITNFDGTHLKQILDAGVNIMSNQVQYSLFDRRVERDFLKGDIRIPLLCYGVVAGGFLSDKYLYEAEPASPLENRSLIKYRLIIEEFGGYELYLELLRLLRRIADEYKVDIADIAMRYILQKTDVAAIIVGVRHRGHLPQLERLNSFRLTERTRSEISKFLEKAKGPKGPFYALERDKEGPHGRIMKYNLNQEK